MVPAHRVVAVTGGLRVLPSSGGRWFERSSRRSALSKPYVVVPIAGVRDCILPSVGHTRNWCSQAGCRPNLFGSRIEPDRFGNSYSKRPVGRAVGPVAIPAAGKIGLLLLVRRMRNSKC